MPFVNMKDPHELTLYADELNKLTDNEVDSLSDPCALRALDEANEFGPEDKQTKKSIALRAKELPSIDVACRLNIKRWKQAVKENRGWFAKFNQSCQWLYALPKRAPGLIWYLR